MFSKRSETSSYIWKENVERPSKRFQIIIFFMNDV